MAFGVYTFTKLDGESPELGYQVTWPIIGMFTHVQCLLFTKCFQVPLEPHNNQRKFVGQVHSEKQSETYNS